GQLERAARQPQTNPALEPRLLRSPPRRRCVALVLARLRADALARRPRIRAQPRDGARLLRQARHPRPPQLPRTRCQRRPPGCLLDRPELLRPNLRPGGIKRRTPTIRPA